MSFVVLVIKLLVENFLISSIPKFSTLSYNFLRILDENFAEIIEVMYPTITADIKLPPAHKSIYPPFFKIPPKAPSSLWIKLVIFAI